LVNQGRVGSYGDVLFNQAEVGAGLSGTLGEAELSAVAMGNLALDSHASAVVESGCSQRRVPLEQWRSLRSALLIGQREQLSGCGREDLRACLRARLNLLRLSE
jgi:hypothetical protein